MKRGPGRRWEPLPAYSPEMSFLSLQMASIISKVLKSLILGLADQQLITGLALLIAALASWQTISGYHLNIVVYLAWFSSYTHAVALFSCGEIFRRSRILLTVRLIGFLVVFALFLGVQSQARDFASVDSGGDLVERNDNGKDGGACPAQCSAMILPYSGRAHQFRIAVIVGTVFGVVSPGMVAPGYNTCGLAERQAILHLSFTPQVCSCGLECISFSITD